MEVRWYTDKVYTSILGFGVLWDRTWMEVRCTFLKPGWVWDDAWIGVKYIFLGLGWRWFIIWKEVGGKYANLDWGETRHGRRETWILESKCSWDADHETWMGVRWDQDLAEMHSLRPGQGDMRLGWGTTGVNCMDMLRDMDGGDTRFLGLELGWDRTWVDARCTTWDLDVFEMVPGWIWDWIYGT